MADISYVGGVAGSRAGSTSTTSQSLTSLTGGSDSAPQEGDLVVVTVGVGSQGRNPDCAISGWSTVGTQLSITVDTYDTSLQVSYKFMTSSPDTSVTIPSSGNIADGQAWAIHVFRGVDPTTPLDVAVVTATGNNTARFDAGPITPTTAGAWVLICGAGAASSNTTAYTAPSGYTTNWRQANGADTNDCQVGAGYYTGWTSGEHNPGVVGGGSTNTANSWAAFTLALRPAADPPVEGTLSQSVGTITLSASGTVTHGTLYHVIYPAAMSEPSATQIKAGQNASGGAATASGNAAASLAGGEYIFDVASGLSAATSYKASFVWSDGTENSNVVTSAAFGTDNTGTLSQSIGTITVSGAGTISIAGTLSQSIGTVSLSATGVTVVVGTLSQSIGTIGLSASGANLVSGALSQSVGSVSLSALAQAIASGSLSQPVGSVSLSALAQAIATGELSSSVGALGLTGAAQAAVSGALGSSVGEVQISALGGVLVTGTLSSSIGELALAADGTVSGQEVFGTLDSSIGDIALSAATGVVDVTGMLDRSTGLVGLSGAGTVFLTGSLDQPVGDVVLTGQGSVQIVGALTLPVGDVTFTGQGQAVATGELDGQLGGVGLSASGAVTVTGTLNLSTGEVSLTGAGGAQASGALQEAIGDLSLSATSAVLVTGSMDADAGPLLLDADGVVGHIPVIGSLNSSVGDILLVAEGDATSGGASGGEWIVRQRREVNR